MAFDEEEMKKFNQFITEAFDKPYPYKLKKVGDNYESDVKLPDGSELQIRFGGMEHVNDEGVMQWEIVFSRVAKGDFRPSTELTGQGDQMRIFATVISAIKQFIKKENPKYMEFSAAKDDPKLAAKDKTVLQSREKLYARFVKKYFAKDYNIERYTSRSGTVWYLERK